MVVLNYYMWMAWLPDWHAVITTSYKVGDSIFENQATRDIYLEIILKILKYNISVDPLK